MSEPLIAADKRARLFTILGQMDQVAVALSGGVDSAYLASAAVDALGSERVVAFTADSPLLPRDELSTARQVAEFLGIEQRVLPFDELADPHVAMNEADRCYHCKRLRFGSLICLAQAEGKTLIHGENAEDRLQYRPGSRAAQELGVRAPLAEAGLVKKEIRELARHRGLPNWDAPAASCLATRFPYGVPLRRESLGRVECAEARLREILGPCQLRVRDHYPLARLEIEADLMPVMLANGTRERVLRALTECGYRYATLDLAGYRSGSFDEHLDEGSRG